MTGSLNNCQIWKRLFFIFALLLVSTTPFNALAIGQLTKPIIVENALRGQEFEESMTIFNSEDKEVTFDLLAEADINGWVTFFDIKDEDLENPISEIAVEANAQKGVNARFLIPDDTPNGEYAGYLSILRKADESEVSTTTATIRQKIARRVSINVTDKEIVDFNANIITQDFGVTIGSPIHLKIVYENNGNTKITPQVQVKTWQTDKVYTNVIHPYPDDLDPVKPMGTQELPIIEVPTDGVLEGKMDVGVSILYKEEVVQEKKFLIGVAKEAAEEPEDQGNAHPTTVGKDMLLYLFGLIIIVIASITFVFKMKRK